MRPVSVSQVNEYIAKRLREDYNLRNLPVEGEISGLSRSGGHLYFSLKDASSSIRCAVWASYRKQLDESLLRDGNKIVALGDISPYARGGTYSISVRQVEAAGEGELMKAFLRIREKLKEEGLFDARHKKAIPSYAMRIGVVTSGTGAAIEDIKKIIRQKNDVSDVVIFPAQVQGAAAPESIIEKIALANRVSARERRIDVLIVGRGGGSPEDLAAFNDEGVARAIFASDIPVISAVGHESDVSISDFVADVRAETPTAAADLAAFDAFSLRQQIAEDRETLRRAMAYKLERERLQLGSLRELLISNGKNRVRENRLIVEKSELALRENDPRDILRKGYAAVLDEGRIVSSVEQIQEGEAYTILVNDGKFSAVASGKERSKD